MRSALAFVVGLFALAHVSQAQVEFYLENAAPETEFNLPVAVAAAPDGRLFVAEKFGRVRVIHPDGTVPAEPFVQLENVALAGDLGLVGIALDPDFEATGVVYLVYAVDQDGDPWNREPTFGRVVRYRASPLNPDRADPTSRHVVIGETVADGLPACLAYHAMGTIMFGTDGTLLIGLGDSASIDAADTGGEYYTDCFREGGVDPAFDVGALRAQMLESPNGKILRVDPENGLGLPSNPFYTGDPADTASKVWALGLRNPFRFSVIEAGSTDPNDGRPGRLGVGDVGWYAAEEVDLVDGGENFGWPCIEGPFVRGDYAATDRGAEVCRALGETEAPAAWWHRIEPERSEPAGLVAQSITAGVVYPGRTYPDEWRGRLFLGDFSDRWIGAATLDGDRITSVEAVSRDVAPVGFDYDPVADAVVVVDIASQAVYRLKYAGASGSPPVARVEADATVGAVPFAVRFSAATSFDPDGGVLAYAWDFGDGATSTEAEPSHAYTEPGRYVARLTVTDPDGGTASTVVRVRMGRALPELVVESPEPGAAYRADEAVAFRASASDPYEPDEDLEIQWAIDLVHNQHVHPTVRAYDSWGGVFEFPEHGDGGEVVFYRFRATVTDGEGLSRSVEREVRTQPMGDVRFDATAVRTTTDDGTIRLDLGVAQRLTRAAFTMSVDPEAVGIELLESGQWRPARSLYVLRGNGEPVHHHVVFEHAEASAVRVTGTPALRPEAVQLYGAWTPELPDGEWTVRGRVENVSASGGRIALIGSEGVQALLAPIGPEGTVTARVVGLGSGDGDGGAGVGVFEAEGGPGAVLFMDRQQRLRLRFGPEDRVLAEGVGVPSWVRLRRVGGVIVASTSPDGETWEEAAVVPVDLSDVLHAGPVVEVSVREALGVFEAVSVEGPSAPDADTVVAALYPNPTPGTVYLRLGAGRIGTYRVSVLSILGREVVAPRRLVVDAPSTERVRLDLGTVASGTYFVRVVHEESGEVVVRTVVVVP